MATRRHHFVPRFYLKNFESQPKMINLYNIPRQLCVEGASLRDQCYKPDYYEDAAVENALAELEGKASEGIRCLISRARSGTINDLDTSILLFVAAQEFRTPSKVQAIRAMNEKMATAVEDTSKREIPGEWREAMALVSPNYILGMMGFAAIWMEDLRCAVVHSPNNAFISSDNPVFKYNQYCETLKNTGTTGANKLGLQVFIPLSPNHEMVLYDGTTYDYVHNHRLTSADIETLNKMQAISARGNIYFKNWEMRNEIHSLVHKVRDLRQRDLTMVEEWGSEDDENDSLIHLFEDTLDISLSLSFLKIKKKALRKPLNKRVHGRRRTQLQDKTARPVASRTVTYSKLKRRF